MASYPLWDRPSTGIGIHTFPGHLFLLQGGCNNQEGPLALMVGTSPPARLNSTSCSSLWSRVRLESPPLEYVLWILRNSDMSW